jgi:hypothetical protein
MEANIRQQRRLRMKMSTPMTGLNPVPQIDNRLARQIVSVIAGAA